MERGAPGDGSSRPRAGEGGGLLAQRTQVLLLAGDQLGPDGGQELLNAFARHAGALSGAGGAPPQPGSGAPSPGSDPSAPSGGQLVFFLCRASSLRDRPERLQEVLRGVREQSRGSPAALVGVIVHPRREEEKDAQEKLEEVLRNTFSDPSVEVHTAIFSPGRPDGALELRRVKQKPSKLQTLMMILLPLLLFGILVFGCLYYIYENNSNNNKETL